MGYRTISCCADLLQCPDQFPTMLLNFLLVRVAMTPVMAFSHRPDGFQSTAVVLTKRLSTGGHVTYELTIAIRGAATLSLLEIPTFHPVGYVSYNMHTLTFDLSSLGIC